jgi:hypothetical protein
MTDRSKILLSAYEALCEVGLNPLHPGLLSQLAPALGPYHAAAERVLTPLRSVYHNAKSDLVFWLIDDVGFNAAAVDLPGIQVVGTTVGAAIALQEHVAILLHLTLSKGQPEEYAGLESRMLPLLRLQGRLSEAQEALRSIRPVDLHLPPGYAQYVRRLAEHALDFLLLHELGHVMRCHSLFLKEMRLGGGSATLVEFGVNRPTFGPEWLQMLELDADRFATRLGVIGCTAGSPQQLEAAFPGILNPEIPWSWELQLRTWLRAIAYLFLVLSAYDRRAIDDRGRTHPHPDVRMSAVASYAFAEWNRVGVDPETYARNVEMVRLELNGLLESGFVPTSPARAGDQSGELRRGQTSKLISLLTDSTPRLDALLLHRANGDF